MPRRRTASRFEIRPSRRTTWTTAPSTRRTGTLTRHLVLNTPGGGFSMAGAVAWSLAVLVVSVPPAAFFFRRLTR